MTGLRNELNAYSLIERRYMRNLEKKLPGCASIGDIRLHLTMEQIERIRKCRRDAFDQLAEMTAKMAELQCRLERVSYEASEAESNRRFIELEALHCHSVLATSSLDSNPSVPICQSSELPENLDEFEGRTGKERPVQAVPSERKMEERSQGLESACSAAGTEHAYMNGDSHSQVSDIDLLPGNVRAAHVDNNIRSPDTRNDAASEGRNSDDLDHLISEIRDARGKSKQRFRRFILPSAHAPGLGNE
ncbi:MAG: hypothetical protein MN733_14620 [Nitrososphaera sp.]|nr:hypothetical protein [Nitrososphaera sp.]